MLGCPAFIYAGKLTMAQAQGQYERFLLLIKCVCGAPAAGYPAILATLEHLALRRAKITLKEFEAWLKMSWMREREERAQLCNCARSLH